MKKKASVKVLMEPGLKDKAEKIFHKLGLTTTQAIRIFYKQVELRGGLPFDVVIPNACTKKTFEHTDGGRDIVVCEDADDMCRKLGL